MVEGFCVRGLVNLPGGLKTNLLRSEQTLFF